MSRNCNELKSIETNLYKSREGDPKIRYGFVVLNYNNFNDTIGCVNSILRIIHRDDYCVVIVDNASPNNSFEVLTSEYEGHPKITLVQSEKNGGYSSGNNIGIRILLEMGVPEVIIATNDTEVISHDLLDKFDELDVSHVGIVGTDVVTPEGIHQNPPLYAPTFLYFLNLYLFEPMAWLRSNIYRCMPAVERTRRSSVAGGIESLGASNVSKNCCSVYMLHGCFLYLTNSYLDKVGLLDENLFMYGEEDLMAWNCEMHRLKKLYLPSVKVLHKDGLSTKLVHKKDKEEFVRTMTIKSKQYLCQKIGKWKLISILVKNVGK
jgi:GT2 family glycosyltransferase